ncbi:MAG TPA: haloacid dehalogenase [Anaerolineaceae bacterium]|uniref:Haloacid dehalogenase superfamily enzyme, subfamily IA n=1 Tax=Anaerolinea thermophila TaxID=167964 RepID=A0A101FXC3_9CHLR|nr:MAG: Haloacid dehalogenase superfamily enzyme, subfamily IA [Anaerolinea thermophila]HAF61919.1 haloacid dehalogenase [Anaerolineaceae bacterium]
MTKTNIKGIIFDFDGLILDTETPEMLAWEKAFTEHSLSFPIERYLNSIGTVSDNHFVQGFMQEMGLSEGEIQQTVLAYQSHIATFEHMNHPREGVLDLIHDAEKIGLRLAVASNSYRTWVVDNLQRLALDSHFDPICTRDDVTNSKPDPELYNLVLAKWGFTSNEVLALEDSPNGIKAAKNAGIFCVAVPNPITIRMDVTLADLIFSSFSDFSLQEILFQLEK